MNNNTSHLKSPNNQNALGRPAIKSVGGVVRGGGGGGGVKQVCGRPTLALCSALILQTLSCSLCMEDSYLSLKNRYQKRERVNK